MKKTEFGSMNCSLCGSEVKVMLSDKGGLSYRCLARGCDNDDYANDSKPLKKKRWLEVIKRFDDAIDPDPVPTPIPAKPAKKTGGSTFFD